MRRSSYANRSQAGLFAAEGELFLLFKIGDGDRACKAVNGGVKRASSWELEKGVLSGPASVRLSATHAAAFPKKHLPSLTAQQD
jgi:hypothetical protein